MLRECAIYIKRHGHHFKILVIFLSFSVPFALLYYTDSLSFEATWKGRTFYLFFIWLFVLELILSWDKYGSKMANKPGSTIRIFVLGVALVLPTVYVVVSNFYGLNAMIFELARQYGIRTAAEFVPLSTEYLVFAALFAAVILLSYGIDGLVDFSLSPTFLGAIGAIYMIDSVYPYGRFIPFQIFVPTTATLAANVLNLMGYQTLFLAPLEGTPRLMVWKTWPYVVTFGIAWPCSGVESLLIYYTVTILLFLKKTVIPWRQRIIYFVIGAIVTYFINVLRIVTIFVIALNGGDYVHFHSYYGQLYSMTWITSYPLIIIGSRILWAKLNPDKPWRKVLK